jgi:S-adenosylmethionine-diacylglycerol 3-amino-3-carboxypropyl transferase
MQPLYDFGLSQEDPLTELHMLNIGPHDNVLCIASGGEVPLTLFCLRPGVKITAVDISASQIMLCRLKKEAAIRLPFPQNALFLGYGGMEATARKSTFIKRILPYLPAEEAAFWMQHLNAIEKGVVNAGRFEGFLRRLRGVVQLLVGKNNLREIIKSPTVDEQRKIFDERIGSRKLLRWIFHLAFHPKVYKNRGISGQGLIHMQSNTGEVFFNKFRNFCTVTPAGQNYFLHYFLMGECTGIEAFPEFLLDKYRGRLADFREKLVFKQISLEDELAAHPRGTYPKIHFSNIGDWMTKQAFDRLLETVCTHCSDDSKLLYRYLQKDHFETGTLCNGRFIVQPVHAERDRFPFYNLISIKPHG